MSTYTYHALASADDTRLVRLEPANNLRDDLVCSLINVPLNHMPSFDALSYVWRNSAHRNPDEMTEEERSVKGTCVTYDGDKSTIYKLDWQEMGESEVDEIRGIYYQLGGERDEGTILLEGHAFAVGFELEEAMRRVRDTEKEQLVWIDAICINQVSDV